MPSLIMMRCVDCRLYREAWLLKAAALSLRRVFDASAEEAYEGFADSLSDLVDLAHGQLARGELAIVELLL